MNRSLTRLAAMLIAIIMLFSLASCKGGDEDAVSVQSVAMLTGMGSIGNVSRYAGMVVSGSTEEIFHDDSMTIDEIKVEEGQDVKAGDILFTYDNEALLLTIEQSKLEIEGMRNTITSNEDMISELERDRNYASESNKLQYTLEIQSLEADNREIEYNITIKEKELAHQESLAVDTEVKASITGRVTSISRDGGYDNYGNVLPFITIVETGNLRIKGVINEMNRASLTEGMSVVIRSRTDDSVVWLGVVEFIDWDNPESGNNEYYYGPVDEQTTSSKYPFYVGVENYDGLFMGQHVYIEPGSISSEGETVLSLPSYFINDIETKPWVWAANSRDKLEKRSVVLGEYDPAMDEYVIESGITAEDYIAFPDETFETGLPVVKYDELSFAGDNVALYGDEEYAVMPGIGG